MSSNQSAFEEDVRNLIQKPQVPTSQRAKNPRIDSRQSKDGEAKGTKAGGRPIHRRYVRVSHSSQCETGLFARPSKAPPPAPPVLSKQKLLAISLISADPPQQPASPPRPAAAPTAMPAIIVESGVLHRLGLDPNASGSPPRLFPIPRRPPMANEARQWMPEAQLVTRLSADAFPNAAGRPSLAPTPTAAAIHWFIPHGQSPHLRPRRPFPRLSPVLRACARMRAPIARRRGTTLRHPRCGPPPPARQTARPPVLPDGHPPTRLSSSPTRVQSAPRRAAVAVGGGTSALAKPATAAAGISSIMPGGPLATAAAPGPYHRHTRPLCRRPQRRGVPREAGRGLSSAWGRRRRGEWGGGGVGGRRETRRRRGWRRRWRRATSTSSPPVRCLARPGPAKRVHESRCSL
jgi:hypothetical protein